MWSRLKKQIAVEEAEIAELIAFHRELLDTGKQRSLTGIELSAAAAFLHSFYSGIENLFRRITIELDDELPRSGDWHRQLLRSMAQSTTHRPRVISDEFQQQLKEYLQFRHLFRNIYTFRLSWERMEPLVLGSERLAQALLAELSDFVEAMDHRQ